MKKLTLITIIGILSIMITPVNVTGDQLADIIAADTLVVGTDPTYAPFEFLNGTTPAGFDIDFAGVLADKLGVSLEVKSVGFDALIPSLVLGEFDVIIAAMTITDARKEIIDFSKPYYNSSQGLLVYEGNPKNIIDETDLNDSDLTIGVQTGTTSDIWVTANAPAAEILRLDSFNELYLKLNLKEIDVILGDHPVIAYASTKGDVKGQVVTTFGSAEQFGVGINKGEATLVTAINNAIDEMMIDGTYDTVFETWFGEIIPGTEDDSPFSISSVVVTLLFSVGVIVVRRRRRT